MIGSSQLWQYEDECSVLLDLLILQKSQNLRKTEVFLYPMNFAILNTVLID